MRRLTLSHAALMLTLASTAACGGASGLAGALPSDSSVSIRVPGGEDESGPSSTNQGLVGDTSEFYVHTYRISRFLNGHVVGLLREIRSITSRPPTSQDGDTSTWGPHTPGGLEPLTYRVVAVKIEDHHYTVALQARPRASTDDADFRTLLDGDLTGSGQEDGRGKGTLSLNFDEAAAINPGVTEQGRIDVAFDAMEFPRRVNIDFVGFAHERAGDGHNATYQYSENEDASGAFLFAVEANIHRNEEARPGLEVMTLRSRWTASGAGRGDVTVSGAEVEAQLSEAGVQASVVNATECWNEQFTVVFQDTAPEQLREHIRPLDGDPAACALESAAYPDQAL